MYVFFKLLSESLLSFYPAMVKYIKFPISNQVWARLTIYSIISAFFMDWKGILSKILSGLGLSLAAVNCIHVFSSYIGFNNLDAGVSYSIFYIYPLILILLAGYKFQWFLLLPILGVILLTYTSWKEQPTNKVIIGISSIFVATITEVLIYFIVKKMNYSNQWNSLFIAYLIPAFVLTVILGKNIIPKNDDKDNINKRMIILLIGNAVIGVLGYYLRFYTIGKLSSGVYGSLSYFGIIMAYVYGTFLNKDKITWQKILGSLTIMSGCIYALFKF